MIYGFMQGETAETCIKPRYTKQDEWVNFEYLHVYHGGEGNKYVQTKETEVRRNTLHYSNERAMSF